MSNPGDASAPRPVIVALHGNFDRPEWQCEVWRRVAGPKPFVLCPRGEPRTDSPAGDERFTWGSYAAVEREVDAAVAALRGRYGSFADPGPLILVGFSLGATMAARLATRSKGAYSHLAIVEGGYEGWTSAGIKSFAKRGGWRVLGACGQPECMTKFKVLSRTFDKAKYPFRIADGGTAGHSYDGQVAAAVSREWAWLVEGDARLTVNR